MTTSIDCKALSKTFLDAIEVTRSLGLRFLWIDSLCIIQDSIEDWATQSAVMGLIYRNSICTIAATAAVDGRDGCFYTRDSSLAEPCKVIISTHRDYGDPSSTMVTSLYVIVPQYIWSDGVNNAPLNQRAWVLQERILSPRTIHFSKYQLFWECKEHVSTAFYLSIRQGVFRVWSRNVLTDSLCVECLRSFPGRLTLTIYGKSGI